MKRLWPVAAGVVLIAGAALLWRSSAPPPRAAAPPALPAPAPAVRIEEVPALLAKRSLEETRRAASRLRAQARADRQELDRLGRIVLDPSSPPDLREIAACVLGSLPGPEAMAYLSQALAGAADPAWTRVLLLAVGEAKDWDDDDVFGLDGQPWTVATNLGLALVVKHEIEDAAVRGQVRNHLTLAGPAALREAAVLALRHSLAFEDARRGFLEIVRGEPDGELQGIIGGRLAEWGAAADGAGRREVMEAIFEIGARDASEALRFKTEPALRSARLDARELSALGELLSGADFDRRRWALSVLGDQARRPDLPGRVELCDRVSRLLASDGDAKIRELSAAALGGYAGDPRAQASLLGALRDAEWNVRARAAETLGKWPAAAPEVLQALRVLERDEHPAVRAAAAAALR